MHGSRFVRGQESSVGRSFADPSLEYMLGGDLCMHLGFDRHPVVEEEVLVGHIRLDLEVDRVAGHLDHQDMTAVPIRERGQHSANRTNQTGTRRTYACPGG